MKTLKTLIHTIIRCHCSLPLYILKCSPSASVCESISWTLFSILIGLGLEICIGIVSDGNETPSINFKQESFDFTCPIYSGVLVIGLPVKYNSVN